KPPVLRLDRLAPQPLLVQRLVWHVFLPPFLAAVGTAGLGLRLRRPSVLAAGLRLRRRCARVLRRLHRGKRRLFALAQFVSHDRSVGWWLKTDPSFRRGAGGRDGSVT